MLKIFFNDDGILYECRPDKSKTPVEDITKVVEENKSQGISSVIINRYQIDLLKQFISSLTKESAQILLYPKYNELFHCGLINDGDYQRVKVFSAV